jgi:hypothetical protein
MTKEEQEVYDEQRKRKWDNEAVKAQQRLDNLAEGKKEIALEMKKDGASIDMIMKYTKLSAEEINAL